MSELMKNIYTFGDIVELKSGSPPLTVEIVSRYTDNVIYQVRWFLENQSYLASASISQHCLCKREGETK